MDEVAVALKLDPLELACAAIRTVTSTRTSGYSSKGATRVLPSGAEAFGWDKRNLEPRSMREGSARDADNSELLFHLLPRLSAVLAREGSEQNARAVGRQPELDQAEKTWPISRVPIGRHPICSQRDNRVL
jgi:hypothetical protein